MAFFIFDTELTPESPRPSEEEIADAKIIYYSPSYVSAEEKRSQVGLVEGLISFASLFGDGKGNLKCMRTKQFAISVLEAEPHTWMVLVMRHPLAISQDGVSKAKANSSSGAQEYDETAISDATLAAVLRNLCSVFQLLHGEIQTFIKEEATHKLLDLLEDFIPAYLDTVDASALGIFQELDGFQYAQTERGCCVSIHCFLDQLREQFPVVKHAALLYNAHLTYTTMTLADTRVLYSYLVSFNGVVSNKKLNKAPFGRIPTAASQPGGGSSSFGRAFLLTEEDDFLLGASRRSGVGGSSACGPSSLFVPTVYLTEGGQGQLVCLTYRGILLVLIFEPDTPLDARLLDSVRLSCTRATGNGLSLAELHPQIAQHHDASSEKEDEFRFVYYNYANHALNLSKQSASSRSILGGSKPPTYGPKPAERPLLPPLHEALNDPKFNWREASMKSADRGWVCAKKWREREFFLLLDGVGMSLSRCQDECARFASLHFNSIFMI